MPKARQEIKNNGAANDCYLDATTEYQVVANYKYLLNPPYSAAS
jgi:hypothetical protein